MPIKIKKIFEKEYGKKRGDKIFYAWENKKKLKGRLKMTYKRNKKGRYSEPKSRSKEHWERGRGAKRKGNPKYKPVIKLGRKVYVLRRK